LFGFNSRQAAHVLRLWKRRTPRAGDALPGAIVGAPERGRKWHRNRLKKLDSRPEIVWPGSAGRPKIWCWEHDRRLQPLPRLSPDAEAANAGCDARVSPTPLLVAAHPHMAPQSFENIDSAPGNGMGPEASTPILWVESSAPPRLGPGPGRARSWPGCCWWSIR
jgi:hypothetical protein